MFIKKIINNYTMNIARIIAESHKLNNQTLKKLYMTTKEFEKDLISQRFKEKIKLLKNLINQSDHYVNFNSSEHQQYAYIHYQGDVARKIINNVENYYKRFVELRNNESAKENAKKYLNNIDNKLFRQPFF